MSHSTSRRLLKAGDLLSLAEYFDDATSGDVLTSPQDHRWTVIGRTGAHLLIQSDRLPYPFAVLPTNQFKYGILKLQDPLSKKKQFALPIPKIDRSSCRRFSYKVDFLCLKEEGEVGHLRVSIKTGGDTRHFVDRGLLSPSLLLQLNDRPDDWIPLGYSKRRDLRDSQWLIGPGGIYYFKQKDSTFFPTVKPLSHRKNIVSLSFQLSQLVDLSLRSPVIVPPEGGGGICYCTNRSSLPQTVDRLADVKHTTCLQSEDFARIQVLDLFLNNRDRRGDSLLIDSNDRVVPMDFELCLLPSSKRRQELTAFLSNLTSGQSVIGQGKLFPSLSVEMKPYTDQQRRIALLSWRKLALLTDAQLEDMCQQLPETDVRLPAILRHSRDLFAEIFKRQFGEPIENLHETTVPPLRREYPEGLLLANSRLSSLVSLDMEKVTIIQEGNKATLACRNFSTLKKVVTTAILQQPHSSENYDYLRGAIELPEEEGILPVVELKELLIKRGEIRFQPVGNKQLVEVCTGGPITFFLCKEGGIVSHITKEFTMFDQPFSTPPESIFLFAVKKASTGPYIKTFSIPSENSPIYYAVVQASNFVDKMRVSHIIPEKFKDWNE